MDQPIFIAVDSGKHSTKVIGKRGGSIVSLSFLTKVKEAENVNMDMWKKGSHVKHVKMDGIEYLIGDVCGIEILDFTLTKQTNVHKMCIYTAIAAIMQELASNETEVEINLAVNMPALIYKNEQRKNELKTFISNDGEPISLELNNKRLTFRISFILVLPEGLGPVYRQTNEFGNERCVVMDIGSLNTTFIEFDHLIPQYNKMTSSELGISFLKAKVAEVLGTKYGTIISDNVSEQALRNQYLYMYGEKKEKSHELIKREMEVHMKEIINFARSRKITLENDKVIVVGGGSLILRNTIAHFLPHALCSNDPIWETAKTFLHILEVKWDAKKKLQC
ncbi:ParM/StbA family protein [Anoxybacillus ayderensis]|uniref:ParM/StbA family protein n=1 Tax=Anoxybacillus ayderensis TaxID=265546 RepID=UPI002E1CD368|nr:ParM/StbA family protein [Anoxybacillus ayderensis]MED0687605.1 ParM/StbA family protein [Anoxybacillus ayderensis]